MYYAIICKLNNVRKHPNADRLQLADIFGNTVIIGTDYKNDDIGIFFGDDGALSPEYLKANDLVARFDENKNRINSGYFEPNGRIKKQKLRGIRSDGLWMPIQSLNFTNGDVSKLSIGTQLNEFNGIKICDKYYTPKTLEKIKNRSQKIVTEELIGLKKHFDTSQFKLEKYKLMPGMRIWLSEKLHGTSGRSGRAYIKRPKFTGILNKILSFFKINPEIKEWKYHYGSRNVIVENTFKEKIDFREKCHERFIDKLYKGEAVYYEIVGYDGNRPIMPSHNTESLKQDKEFINKFGKEITYHYGQKPGSYEIYVYRMTKSDEDGIVIEYPFDLVMKRCEEIGVKHVPILEGPIHFDGDLQKLEDKINGLVEMKESQLSKDIHVEGVCVRYEGFGKSGIMKQKSWYFGVLEGYIKNNDNYIDTEEIA